MSKVRSAIERKIVLSLFDVLVANDLAVSIDYGEDKPEPSTRDRAIFEKQIQACDEEWLRVYSAESSRYVGSVYLVYGNDDGTTVISDYTTNLESFIKPVLELSDALADGEGVDP